MVRVARVVGLVVEAHQTRVRLAVTPRSHLLNVLAAAGHMSDVHRGILLGSEMGDGEVMEGASGRGGSGLFIGRPLRRRARVSGSGRLSPLVVFRRRGTRDSRCAACVVRLPLPWHSTTSRVRATSEAKWAMTLRSHKESGRSHLPREDPRSAATHTHNGVE